MRFEAARQRSNHVPVDSERQQEQPGGQLRHHHQHAAIGRRIRIDRRGVAVARLYSQNLHGQRERFGEQRHHQADRQTEARLGRHPLEQRPQLGESAVQRHRDRRPGRFERKRDRQEQHDSSRGWSIAKLRQRNEGEGGCDTGQHEKKSVQRFDGESDLAGHAASARSGADRRRC